MPHPDATDDVTLFELDDEVTTFQHDDEVTIFEHDDEVTTFEANPWGARQRVIPDRRFVRGPVLTRVRTAPALPGLPPAPTRKPAATPSAPIARERMATRTHAVLPREPVHQHEDAAPSPISLLANAPAMFTPALPVPAAAGFAPAMAPNVFAPALASASSAVEAISDAWTHATASAKRSRIAKPLAIACAALALVLGYFAQGTGNPLPILKASASAAAAVPHGTIESLDLRSPAAEASAEAPSEIAADEPAEVVIDIEPTVPTVPVANADSESKPKSKRAPAKRASKRAPARKAKSSKKRPHKIVVGDTGTPLGSLRPSSW